MKTEELKEQLNPNKLPKHIGIILDGNGRWAQERGLPRTLGHQKGIETLGKIVKATKELGIKNLTVFAFSTENINRPKDEVKYLFNRMKDFFNNQYQQLKKEKVNVKIIGELVNLPTDLVSIIKEINDRPFNYDYFTFTIAFNYGSRQEIVNATKQVASLVKIGKLKINDINEKIIEENLYTKDLENLDLIIRTSGELRLSNFLLWQASYAELSFPKVYFPDFNEEELYKVLIDYQTRDRRFGKIGEKVA